MGLRRWWGARSRNTRRRLVVYPAILGAGTLFVAYMTSMPGRSHRGALPALDDDERRLAAELKRDVEYLSSTIGERSMGKAGSLDRSWQRIASELEEAGYRGRSAPYQVDGKTVANVFAVKEATSGRKDEIVVVGAHYDSVVGVPGADDNASGVAVLLALARAFEKRSVTRELRFVAFVNEEPPYFWNESMGSLHYAKDCRAHDENIVAMLSLESLGYYRDEPGSQKYPPVVSWLYPDRGDFVGFIGNLSSRSLVRRAIGTFRKVDRFPSEGAAMPSWVSGVGWSDHWSFWHEGYPAVMVTDTAVFRNPSYHTTNDVPATLDYDRLARVTSALVTVVSQLAN